MRYEWEKRPSTRTRYAVDYHLIDAENEQVIATVALDGGQWAAYVRGLKGYCLTRIDAMRWVCDMAGIAEDEAGGWYA